MVDMLSIGKYIYQHFGFDMPTMATKVLQYLQRRKDDVLLEREFVEL